jgi:hypothetical protein
MRDAGADSAPPSVNQRILESALHTVVAGKFRSNHRPEIVPNVNLDVSTVRHSGSALATQMRGCHVRFDV